MQRKWTCCMEYNFLAFLLQSYYLYAHHEGICGCGDRAPLILHLRTRSRQAISFIPRPLYPCGENSMHQYNRRPGGTQRLSTCFGEDRNVSSWPWIEPQLFDQTDHNLLREMTELPRLQLCFTVQLDMWTISCAGKHYKQLVTTWNLKDLNLLGCDTMQFH
jgi:hypothetical protein